MNKSAYRRFPTRSTLLLFNFSLPPTFKVFTFLLNFADKFPVPMLLADFYSLALLAICRVVDNAYKNQIYTPTPAQNDLKCFTTYLQPSHKLALPCTRLFHNLQQQKGITNISCDAHQWDERISPQHQNYIIMDSTTATLRQACLRTTITAMTISMLFL